MGNHEPISLGVILLVMRQLLHTSRTSCLQFVIRTELRESSLIFPFTDFIPFSLGLFVESEFQSRFHKSCLYCCAIHGSIFFSITVITDTRDSRFASSVFELPYCLIILLLFGSFYFVIYTNLFHETKFVKI